MKKKILIVTERRADYSKFRPILEQISKSHKLKYYLIVTGSHLLEEHGHTIDEIKQDGFKIYHVFSMYNKNRSDTGAEMVRAFGRSILSLSDLIEKINPDIILSGFDIGANFAASIIGAHMNILVAHVEGGEVTGTIDDSIRHATTKFSHIHFTSNLEATKRIIKMGENPKYVFTVGNPSLDAIRKIRIITKKDLEKKFQIDFTKPYVVVVQHTVTSEIDQIDRYVSKTLDALEELNIQALIIHGNADAGSKKISKVLKNSNIKQYSSIHFDEFINLLRYSSALVGNSSAGIIETPFLHIPSINIGTRQNGRLRAESIIDVNYDKNQIKKALMKVIWNKSFRKRVKNCKSLYGDGFASKRIVKILENLKIENIPIQKKLAY